ncbi:MAG: Ig-like domain-containing protein [Anaerolineae bacterium]
MTADVAAGVATDAAGNSNTAATQFSISYDGTAPTTTLSSTATSPTNTSPIPVTVTFSESVTGFVDTDVTVTNGTVSNFAGSNATYTFDVTPIASGTVTVDVAAGVATDTAGNGNTVATQFSITYDASAPTTTISSTATSPTSTSLIPVTVTFSESVTGFADTDVVVGNGSVSNFAGSGALYTFDVTPSGGWHGDGGCASERAADSAAMAMRPLRSSVLSILRLACWCRQAASILPRVAAAVTS